MTAQELKDTGHRLVESCEYAEALPLLKLAVKSFPDDLSIFVDLVVSASETGNHDQALEFAKQGVQQHPRSDWLWRQVGVGLTRVDRLDEAEKALNNAHSLNPKSEWLWRNLADLCLKQKNLEKEIDALETLYAFGKAEYADLNQLGSAYYKHQSFAKALKYLRLSAATKSDIDPLGVFPLYNMGLVFSSPEVSQDADAADAYRRALVCKPDYEHAKESLDTTKRKLVLLAERARVEAMGLVQLDDLFHFYISPFEVFKIEDVESIEELGVKNIQRAKKRLIQEIDLNDGKLSWLDDYPLDKSRALAIENDLHDETKRRFHWAIFQNKWLLGFLTRGDIRHFLYADAYFPHDTLKLLDGEPEFRAFLSKPFARQYNFVLTRAIERRLLSVVEVLFDGRRWVEPEDEDICFGGAFKHIGNLVKQTQSKVIDGRVHKVSLREIEEFLRQHSLPHLFNLLPTAFASAQRDIVSEIRSLAISCFNEHDDPNLSKGILGLCNGFTSRSVELTNRLKGDYEIIERMIAEDRKHESRLTFGSDRPFEITKEGIRDREKFFPSSTIRDLRWGITHTICNEVEKYEYFLAVGNDAGDTINASWETTWSDHNKQTEYFSSMVNAALNYLGGPVSKNFKKQLLEGKQVVVGPCTMTRQGIAFQTQGFFFKKDQFVPWYDITTDTGNGLIVVSSKAHSKIAISIPMRDTHNAVLLPILIAMMEREHV